MTAAPTTLRSLAAARLWAVNRLPYLASAIFAAHVAEEPGSGTIAVDRTWGLRADPVVVEALSVEELGRLVLHLAGHLLRDHADRAERLGVATDHAGPRWNRCADGR